MPARNRGNSTHRHPIDASLSDLTVTTVASRDSPRAVRRTVHDVARSSPARKEAANSARNGSKMSPKHSAWQSATYRTDTSRESLGRRATPRSSSSIVSEPKKSNSRPATPVYRANPVPNHNNSRRTISPAPSQRSSSGGRDCSAAAFLGAIATEKSVVRRFADRLQKDTAACIYALRRELPSDDIFAQLLQDPQSSNFAVHRVGEVVEACLASAESRQLHAALTELAARDDALARLTAEVAQLEQQLCEPQQNLIEAQAQNRHLTREIDRLEAENRRLTCLVRDCQVVPQRHPRFDSFLAEFMGQNVRHDDPIINDHHADIVEAKRLVEKYRRAAKDAKRERDSLQQASRGLEVTVRELGRQLDEALGQRAEGEGSNNKSAMVMAEATRDAPVIAELEQKVAAVTSASRKQIDAWVTVAKLCLKEVRELWASLDCCAAALHGGGGIPPVISEPQFAIDAASRVIETFGKAIRDAHERVVAVLDTSDELLQREDEATIWLLGSFRANLAAIRATNSVLSPTDISRTIAVLKGADGGRFHSPIRALPYKVTTSHDLRQCIENAIFSALQNTDEADALRDSSLLETQPQTRHDVTSDDIQKMIVETMRDALARAEAQQGPSPDPHVPVPTAASPDFTRVLTRAVSAAFEQWQCESPEPPSVTPLRTPPFSESEGTRKLPELRDAGTVIDERNDDAAAAAVADTVVAHYMDIFTLRFDATVKQLLSLIQDLSLTIPSSFSRQHLNDTAERDYGLHARELEQLLTAYQTLDFARDWPRTVNDFSDSLPRLKSLAERTQNEVLCRVATRACDIDTLLQEVKSDHHRHESSVPAAGRESSSFGTPVILVDDTASKSVTDASAASPRQKVTFLDAGSQVLPKLSAAGCQSSPEVHTVGCDPLPVRPSVRCTERSVMVDIEPPVIEAFRAEALATSNRMREVEENYESRVAQLHAQIRDLEEQLEASEASRGALAETNNDLRQRMVRMEKDKERSLSAVTAFEHTVEELRKELDFSRHRWVALENAQLAEIDVLKVRNNDLSERLALEESRNASLHAKLAFLKIPHWGITGAIPPRLTLPDSSALNVSVPELNRVRSTPPMPVTLASPFDFGLLARLTAPAVASDRAKESSLETRLDDAVSILEESFKTLPPSTEVSLHRVDGTSPAPRPPANLRSPHLS